jgi:Ca2+-binding RTX toxin-like protein
MAKPIDTLEEFGSGIQTAQDLPLLASGTTVASAQAPELIVSGETPNNHAAATASAISGPSARNAAGDPVLSASNTRVTVFGTEGDDHIFGITFGQPLDYIIYGYGGSDSIIGNTGNDELYDGNGNDTILAQDGDDHLDGGAGIDYLSGDGGRDTLLGGADDDSLDGGNGDDSLSGEDGDDTLEGRDGTDELLGGAGNDILDGGAGDDRLGGGEGHDVLLGSSGDDHLIGGAGADSLSGGDGVDNVSYITAVASVRIDLNESSAAWIGDAQGDVLSSIDRFFLTDFNDIFIGDASLNVVFWERWERSTPWS